MSKKLDSTVKLQVPAGKANPAPPVGTALGPRGVNIMEFCKAFNEKSKTFEVGTPLPVVMSIYKDKSFTFEIKTPPASFYLKKAANITKGASATKKDPNIAFVTMDQCRDIAKIKLNDMNAYDIESAAKIIKGSAESMGIEVKN